MPRALVRRLPPFLNSRPDGGEMDRDVYNGAMRRSEAFLLCFGLSVLAAEEPITIDAKFNHGRVILPAKLNGNGPFSFLLDTACTIPTVHPAMVDELSLQQRGFVR